MINFLIYINDIDIIFKICFQNIKIYQAVHYFLSNKNIKKTEKSLFLII
jgi:hypothetical protein